MSASPSPSDDHSGLFDDALLGALAEAHECVQDLEPKVRELNRVLVPLLGKCPTTIDGGWAYLAKDDNDEFIVALATIPMDKVLALVARVGEILEIVSDSTSAIRVRDSYQPDLGPSIVGEVARLTQIPRTHIPGGHK